jgi:hypothetical protein
MVHISRWSKRRFRSVLRNLDCLRLHQTTNKPDADLLGLILLSGRILSRLADPAGVGRRKRSATYDEAISYLRYDAYSEQTSGRWSL